MASAPYVALLLPTAPVVHVNVPSSKPWLQRHVASNCAGGVVHDVPSSKPWLQRRNVALLPTAPGSLRECAVIETTWLQRRNVALLPNCAGG
ncbi:hypothetical protein EVAR_91165_1 [Eumeta japonica]|uniref:Uncharacterized protein n=1 Tax=Eumeta variegata TaxID=151549 RepID=A0A4C2A120_EUMVA|nr:hypothetical protein EVAR_91165_1 [Eumeta japonica]